MSFRSLLKSLQSRPSVADVRRSSRRPTSRMQVEALEDRCVPAAISDPVGDFLSAYTGPHHPGLDVVAHEVVYLEDQDRLVFIGRMAGPIAPTGAIGGRYVTGLDRGQGTPRFRNPPAAPPIVGPNVLFDSVVTLLPNGTGTFVNLVAGAAPVALDPADITISGNEYTVSLPVSLLLPASTRPPEQWTYNLWPRNGQGLNVQISDLAPDDGNSPVQTIAPARVANVIINDGSAQRSMVNRLTVTFDGPVTLDSEAFELRRQDGSLVGLSVAASEIEGSTVAILTFTGPDILAGSLADGNYTLTIRSGMVHDVFGRVLDGEGDGTAGGDRVETFFRLFGDTDGDRDVDHFDFRHFVSAFGRRAGDPQYLSYLDYDGSGVIDSTDLLAFAERLIRGS